MESTTDAVSIDHEVTIAASPETVWSFLVDPDKATRWMGLTAEIDARPGGIYRCDVIPGHTASGEFVEVDAPRRLVFTWGWEPVAGEPDAPNAVAPGSSTIEIELVPSGEGTLLRFVHRGLPTPESADSHGHGWDHYLERLETAATGGDPGRDSWLDGVS
jgi:uncharacterized protein YndB with AHSA1/START domain